jgi:hypothetical protein
MRELSLVNYGLLQAHYLYGSWVVDSGLSILNMMVANESSLEKKKQKLELSSENWGGKRLGNA